MGGGDGGQAVLGQACLGGVNGGVISGIRVKSAWHLVGGAIFRCALAEGNNFYADALRGSGAAEGLSASVSGDSPEPLRGSEEEAVEPGLGPPQLQGPDREYKHQNYASAHKVGIAQQGCQNKHSERRLCEVVGQGHSPDCTQPLLEPVIGEAVPEDDEAHVSQGRWNGANDIGYLADEGYLAGVIVQCGNDDAGGSKREADGKADHSG